MNSRVERSLSPLSLWWYGSGHPWVDSQSVKKAEQCVLCISIQEKYSKLGSTVRDSDKCDKMIVRNKGMEIVEFRIVVILRLFFIFIYLFF